MHKKKSKPISEIVLYQPDIPQNVGNIARTCAVSGTKLSLVTPLGFSLGSRHLKRSGLDYWKDVDFQTVEDLDTYLLKAKRPFYFFSSKAQKFYSEIAYPPEALLIFGSETQGLPEKYREQWEENFLTIPMKQKARCLNLSTSVGIVLYEVLRQQQFTQCL